MVLRFKEKANSADLERAEFEKTWPSIAAQIKANAAVLWPRQESKFSITFESDDNKTYKAYLMSVWFNSWINNGRGGNFYQVLWETGLGSYSEVCLELQTSLQRRVEQQATRTWPVSSFLGLAERSADNRAFIGPVEARGAREWQYHPNLAHATRFANNSDMDTMNANAAREPYARLASENPTQLGAPYDTIGKNWFNML